MGGILDVAYLDPRRWSTNSITNTLRAHGFRIGSQCPSLYRMFTLSLGHVLNSDPNNLYKNFINGLKSAISSSRFFCSSHLRRGDPIPPSLWISVSFRRTPPSTRRIDDSVTRSHLRIVVSECLIRQLRQRQPWNPLSAGLARTLS